MFFCFFGKFMSKSQSFTAFALIICTIYVFSWVQTSQAQATSPIEVRALNSIFQKWKITPDRWNISGEPCSGLATDSTQLDSVGYNPAIKCHCDLDNGATCRVVEMKIINLNIQGVILEELRNLTHLWNLNLGNNYLSGPLPGFIGELTRMQYLNFGKNILSGEVPKELGNLTNLISVGFGYNNFSGSLPPELGNLAKLEQLYFESGQMSGEIPSTFVKLQNLKIFVAFDNQLTGRIPDFIGNLTKLTILKLHGNFFEGPIPLTFSNLVSLTELRISDLSNRSSSLAFIKDMKALVTLILRNNNISDTIPSNIGEYQSLIELDLSFNNLTGQIPSSLFELSSLSYLFLGNNQLTGAVPSQKSVSLRNIDLSYNGLSGSFPSWVTEEALQINLVANNFSSDSSSRSFSSSGLNCLQRNFPCYRGSPVYSSFAIKCGGPKFKSSNGTVYESDNTALGPASYFVSDTKRWAVSNVGKFAEGNNVYTRSSPSLQFTNTLDSELYQSARLSPGSLRYYGLALENGKYTVNLQFAETEYPNNLTWQSRGRRVFDIYIQGNLLLKDFDIRKEAGGVSFRAVQKNFQAQVSENFLEIHFYWAGKGTCCIPINGVYGPSISAISVTPDFIPTVSNTLPTEKKRTGLVVGIVVAVGVVSFLFVFVVCCKIKRRKGQSSNVDEELEGIAAGPNTFSYAELRTATEDFNPANKLGEGGFGPVYRGALLDGRVVAVKQLLVESHHGRSQFVTEIATISAVKHRNLVKLYGCCIEGDKRLLVYEYLANKSLDKALFGNSGLHLNWPTRYDICLGTALGLAYLHEESRPRIVHRDVKASNILLDADLTPKISDFGLAKLYDDKMTHISTRVAGTIGYLAPEYAMRGHLTEKADVFGFGVVIMEIVSGRKNSDPSLDEAKMYLLDWAWHLHENNCESELVDPMLSEFNGDEAKRVIGVALLCIQSSPVLRPPMSRVVAMLSGDIEVSTVMTKPGYLTDLKFSDISSFMSDDTLTTSMPRTANSQPDLPNPSMVVDGDNSPVHATRPMLHEII